MGDRQKQDELDIKNLRILRAIVYNEIMNIDTELREEDPASYRRRCIHKVQPIQDKLQSFGNAVSRVSGLAIMYLYCGALCGAGCTSALTPQRRNSSRSSGVSEGHVVLWQP